MNSINLIGNLTKDPELRDLPSGTSVCKMRLAVNTRRKDSSSGEWVSKPNYIDVTAFAGRADVAAEYLLKGSRVGVSGRLETREWEADDGSKRSGFEVIADQIDFLSPKSKDEPEGASATEDEEASEPVGAEF